jgi:hypothetical protein
MKKMDMLVAMALALIVSFVVIWYAQPAWYLELRTAVREWREPSRRPQNRYEERNERRRHGRVEGEGNTASENSRTDGPLLTFAVVNATTDKPVTSFRYRRVFNVAPREQSGQQTEWTDVSNSEGTFRISAANIYVPINTFERNKSIRLTEVWKSAIEDGMQRKGAESDTLEIQADGFEDGSVRLFELLNGPRADFDGAHPVRLDPVGSTRDDTPPQLRREIASIDDAAREDVAQWKDRNREAGQPAPPGRSAALQGVITVSGKHPREGTVSIRSAETAEDYNAALESNGAYRIDGLTPGSWTVGVNALAEDAVWRDHSETIDLADGTTEFNYDFVKAGSLVGTVSGLREGESGGVFAMKGDYTLSNVTEDDLYDFGDICEGEARVVKDGTFTIRELEPGHYTIIAISERLVPGQERAFYYVTGGVDIAAGTQAEISLSLK